MQLHACWLGLLVPPATRCCCPAAQVEADKHKRDKSDAWNAEAEQAFKQKIVDRCGLHGRLSSNASQC
jgi:hypothetical protein